MGYNYGEPIKGILHSTDASAGVEIPVFLDGAKTAYTLAADEYITITKIFFVQAAAGDGHVFIGPDASPGTGETVIRGTFVASGGAAVSSWRWSGSKGEKAFVIAPAGVVDVQFIGELHREGRTIRQSWQASTVPGQ